jgi:hypothetical protein
MLKVSYWAGGDVRIEPTLGCLNGSWQRNVDLS